MAASKTTTKKTATKVKEETVVPEASASGQTKRNPAARRVTVQYTPRIPTARCPWC